MPEGNPQRKSLWLRRTPCLPELEAGTYAGRCHSVGSHRANDFPKMLLQEALAINYDRQSTGGRGLLTRPQWAHRS